MPTMHPRALHLCVERISSRVTVCVLRVLGGREKLGLGVKILEMIVLNPGEVSEVRGVECGERGKQKEGCSIGESYNDE